MLREIAGVKLPVMPQEDLIAYKLALGRPVDVLDVAEIRVD